MASSRWKARRQSAPVAHQSHAMPAGACSAAPAPSAAKSTPSEACTSATSLARSRPEHGSEAASKRASVLIEDGRATGVRCAAGAARGENGNCRPYTVRARKATVVAGGALGNARAVAAVQARGKSGRPEPPHPSRLLGGSPLSRAGARLGRGDAELLHRRVGASADPARGDLHAAAVRRCLAARRGTRAPRGNAGIRADRVNRSPPLRRVQLGASGLPWTARCA